jgi:hypothetical protein
MKARGFDLPHLAHRVFGTPLVITRAKLEVILGVLAPRFVLGPIERVDPMADPAPLTSITVEQIAVVSVIGTLVSAASMASPTSTTPPCSSNRGIAWLELKRERPDCRSQSSRKFPADR